MGLDYRKVPRFLQAQASRTSSVFYISQVSLMRIHWELPDVSISKVGYMAKYLLDNRKLRSFF